MVVGTVVADVIPRRSMDSVVRFSTTGRTSVGNASCSTFRVRLAQSV